MRELSYGGVLICYQVSKKEVKELMTGNKIGGYAAGWDFVDFKVCKGVKKSNTERRKLNKRMRNFLKRDAARMIKDVA